MGKLERDYQPKLIKRIEDMFPGCLILKNDSGYLQGVPDLSIFYNDRWAMLEVKNSGKSKRQPNQEHYTERMNDMSFCAFIHPDNEEEVLNALQSALAPSGHARNTQRK